MSHFRDRKVPKLLAVHKPTLEDPSLLVIIERDLGLPGQLEKPHRGARVEFQGQVSPSGSVVSGISQSPEGPSLTTGSSQCMGTEII